MLNVLGILLVLVFGRILIEADITADDWEFWALLVILFCYGGVKYFVGYRAAQ